MLLTTYSPFEKQIDEFFKDVLNGSSTPTQTWVPRCDVYEDANGFSVTAAIPAVDPKEVTITMEDGMLILSGARKWQAKTDARNYVVREISGGTFSRSFRLPENVDTEKVSARYQNGMLTIDLPKKEEAKPRRIEIEVK